MSSIHDTRSPADAIADAMATSRFKLDASPAISFDDANPSADHTDLIFGPLDGFDDPMDHAFFSNSHSAHFAPEYHAHAGLLPLDSLDSSSSASASALHHRGHVTHLYDHPDPYGPYHPHPYSPPFDATNDFLPSAGTSPNFSNPPSSPPSHTDHPLHFDPAGLYPRGPSIASPEQHFDLLPSQLGGFKSEFEEGNYYLARWSTVPDLDPAADSPSLHPASLPVSIPSPVNQHQHPFIPYAAHNSFPSHFTTASSHPSNQSPQAFVGSLPPSLLLSSAAPLSPVDQGRSFPFPNSAANMNSAQDDGGGGGGGGGLSAQPQTVHIPPTWASQLWGNPHSGSSSRFPQGQPISAPRTAVPVLATTTAMADLSSSSTSALHSALDSMPVTTETSGASVPFPSSLDLSSSSPFSAPISPTARAPLKPPFWLDSSNTPTIRGYPSSAPSSGGTGPIRLRARRYSHRAGSADKEDPDATVRPRRRRVTEETAESSPLSLSRPRAGSERRSESPAASASPPAKSTLRPPKLAPSTWQLYFTDWIQRHQMSNDKKLNVAQAAKEAGAEYAALAPEEKEPYKRRSQALKEARERELASWMSTLTPADIKKENIFRAAQRKAGKSRRGNIKDPNAPKKPLSAYFMFLQRIRSDPGLVRDVFGDEQETTKQSVLAAARWRAMTDDERKPFLAQAEQEKLDYEEKRRLYEDTPSSYTNISFSILPNTPAQLVAAHSFKLERTASESESDGTDAHEHDAEAHSAASIFRR